MLWWRSGRLGGRRAAQRRGPRRTTRWAACREMSTGEGEGYGMLDVARHVIQHLLNPENDASACINQ